MTIQDVADLLQVSKKKVWTAVKNGQLEAEKMKRGKAWRYSISRDAAEAYKLSMEDSGDWEAILEPEETGNATKRERSETGNVSWSTPSETQRNGNATVGNGAETVRELFNRLELAHRKQIYLEMQVQQSQRLLCEVNEDQHEREARTKEAEAKLELAQKEAGDALLTVELAQQEAAQVKIELESLKTDMATKEAQWAEQRKPWWKKMFKSG